jgi:hypothetical protein
METRSAEQKRRGQLGVALVLLGSASSACFMTADESLWKNPREAGARERGSDRPQRDLAADLARRDDRPLVPDLRADGPARDAKPDSAKPDAAKPDSAKPDSAKTDSAKPDLKPLADKPKPDLSCGQLSLTVTSNDDDGMLWDPYFAPSGDPDSNCIWMGYWDSKNEWGWFRFALPQALSAQAKITSVTLSLWGVDDDSAAGSALEIYLENSSDAAVVTGLGDAPFLPGGRPVTSVLRWPASGGLAWSLSQYNVTPNLAALLQGLVTSKGGLASGAHVQLWIRGAQTIDSDMGTGDYAIAGYSSHPHTLSISFCQ